MGELILNLFKVSFYLGMGGVFIICSFKILDLSLRVFAEIFGAILELIHKTFGGT